MTENVIFCYSGTGNCLDMAKNIASALGDTDIIMMRSTPAVTDVREAKRVGFVVPCYGGGLPGGVEESIRRIQVGPMAYTFAVGQYAGYPGNGLAVIDSVIRLNYWQTVSHHCSAIWLFPHNMMLPPMSVEKAQRRSAKFAREVAGAALEGRRSTRRPIGNIVNAAESAVWPKLAAKRAKELAVNDDCIGCGQCERLCPTGNIKMVGGRPQFGSGCIQCLGCLQYCPKSAITCGEVTQKREHYHNPNVTANELMQAVIHVD